MIRRPPRSTLLTHSFPTRRSSDLYSDRVLRNCGKEFRAAVEAFAVGYRDGIGQPKFNDLQVRDALIAIEVGNIIDGLSRIFAMPGVRALRAPAILVLVQLGRAHV